MSATKPIDEFVKLVPSDQQSHSSATAKAVCPFRGKWNTTLVVAFLNFANGNSACLFQFGSVSCSTFERSTDRTGGDSLYSVSKEKPSSVSMFEFVAYATISWRPSCSILRCTMDVCRPSLTSSTLKVAEPAPVRRKNSTCRSIVCGWFCFASVVLKWVLTTSSMHPVTYPPLGTTEINILIMS